MKNQSTTYIKESAMTGKTNMMVLPISVLELHDGLARHAKGELIQDVFPLLSADEREFLMTGITPEEWDYLFNDAPYPHSEVSPFE